MNAGSDQALHLLEHWLERMRALRGVSDATVEAYRHDVSGYLGFLGNHLGGDVGKSALAAVSISDMRAWLAFERNRGLSARSLARALSAVKSFYRWLGEDFGIETTPDSPILAPNQNPRLPPPLKP